MSRSADDAAGPAGVGLDALESAVARAVARLGALDREVERQRRRAEHLDRLLTRIAGGELDASGLTERLEALEAENQLLHARMAEAREGAGRLLARIRFLEEQR
jgi:predicted RNase H-like nuclease (RuvC/YqgF family)